MKKEMILRKIEFECMNKDINYAYAVKKRAKFITNYINRNCLSKIKYKSNDFNIIVIYLTENIIEPYIVNNGLVVPILFDSNRYNKIISTENYFEYYYEKIKETFEIIKGKYETPENNIIQILNELKTNDYKNKWTHKIKTVKNLKLYTSLDCELTINEFILALKINKNDKELLNEIILKTDPDEVAFEYKFKDIIIEDEAVIITEKSGNKLYEYKIKNNETGNK